ncbi:MAG: hypothetical protein IT456_18890 [Planctomycetes bacterium]|nr:hypothetical protein [Planctomycetota bacterium]
MQSGLRLALSSAVLTAGFVLGVGAMEYLNPKEELKPSYLIGTLAGRLTAAEVKAAEQAKIAFTEGVKAGELRAQIVYDEKVLALNAQKDQAFATLQANLDRTSRAYEALYQVGIQTAQAAMAMEADLVRIRATTVGNRQTFRGLAAEMADLVGILSGNPLLNGDQYRDQIVDSINRSGAAGVGDLAQIIRTTFKNPADFRIEQESVLQYAFGPVQVVRR